MNKQVKANENKPESVGTPFVATVSNIVLTKEEKKEVEDSKVPTDFFDGKKKDNFFQGFKVAE